VSALTGGKPLRMVAYSEAYRKAWDGAATGRWSELSDGTTLTPDSTHWGQPAPYRPGQTEKDTAMEKLATEPPVESSPTG